MIKYNRKTHSYEQIVERPIRHIPYRSTSYEPTLWQKVRPYVIGFLILNFLLIAIVLAHAESIELKASWSCE
jgi:hypothetical protein